ncbi:MAG: hypothetical protein IH793_08150 [Acidobacteria bacterium]|nr:hypothetical protein [Acidobacteriota bacterium]
MGVAGELEVHAHRGRPFEGRGIVGQQDDRALGRECREGRVEIALPPDPAKLLRIEDSGDL